MAIPVARQYSYAILADGGFVQRRMKFARREGAQVFLVPLGAGIRNVMRKHADLILPISALSPS